jgi:hypothetical protein
MDSLNDISASLTLADIQILDRSHISGSNIKKGGISHQYLKETLE